MQLHLIDATYELYRAHFGAPDVRAPDGRPVGAVVGLLRSIAKLLREDDVTHVAAATDTVIESFRNDLFEGYKTGEGVPEELWAQFPLAERALRALGLRVWPMREFEADDALASAAHRFREQVDRVLLLTPDKDLAQCVRGHRVVLVDRRREAVIDEAGVLEKWGVAPESIPDYLALVGDRADGIPGLKGWGARGSASVLRRYGCIENIPEDPDLWDVKVRGAARLARSLADARQDALLYRQLATLRIDAPVDQNLEALSWAGADRTRFEALASELGVPRLVDRVVRWAGSSAAGA